MKITVKQLKGLIREAIAEVQDPSRGVALQSNQEYQDALTKAEIAIEDLMMAMKKAGGADMIEKFASVSAPEGINLRKVFAVLKDNRV